MTSWDDIVARGSGAVEYRLVIEGCQIEICTSPWMTGDCVESGHEGKRRVAGLVREGLGFNEQCYLAGAELEVTISPFRIIETPYPDLDAATRVFSAIPNVVGALDNSLAFDAPSALVFNTGGFAVDGYYHLGREVVRVDAIPDAVSLDITRGLWGTTAATHNTSSATSHQERPFRDGVQIWKHRRFWLYAHTVSELDTASTGAVVMRGVISTEPELVDEGTWQLGAESRTMLLEQEVAAGADIPKFPRGIYYPAGYPLALSVRRSDTTVKGETTSEPAVVRLCGFFETNEQFGASLVDALTAEIDPLWDLAWRVVPMPDGRWELMVRTASSDQRYIEVGGGSPVDGWFMYSLSPSGWTGGGMHPAVSELSAIDGTAARWYYCVWTPTPYGVDERTLPGEVLRQVPRTINYRTTFFADITLEATYPLGRQYLDDVGSLIIGDTVISSAEWITASTIRGDVSVLHVADVNVTDGYIVAHGTTSTGVEVPSMLSGAGTMLPSFQMARIYSEIEGSTVAVFRDRLVEQAPLYGNDGSVPWITDDDLADWDVPVFLAAQAVWQTHRLYAFYRGEQLSEVLREEFRLLGVFPYLDADFKIALRPLTFPTEPVAEALEITGANHITDRGYGSIRAGSDGAVNRVEISRGYNPREDKYELSPVVIQDIAGISDAGGFKAVLEIKPKSGAPGGDITPAEAEYLSAPARVLFSGKITHVEVDVPLTLWNVLVGDMVTLTIPQLPMAGKRGVHDPNEGMTQRRALVVGRRWDFDDPAGTFTCLVVGLNVAGYAPTGRIASAAGAGTSWVVTLETNHYSPTGAVDAAYFNVGDVVWLVPWDAPGTSVKEGGTITAITDDDVSITFATAWAGLGSDTWNIVLAPSDEVPVARLATTAFIAAEDRVLTDSDADERTAHVFAP
jgi:hypothetical protein